MALRFPDQPKVLEGDLPSFGFPPVSEMTMGFMFDALRDYNSILAAQYFEQVRREYPKVEEHPALTPTFETFGGGAMQELQIELLPASMQSRFFFLNDDRSELLQLQRDRLHFNWRKLDQDRVYPRYPPLRRKFLEAWDELDRWAEENAIGSILPTQCEIAYVNTLRLVDRSGASCGLSHYFNWLAGLEGITEDGVLQFRRRLVNEAGVPVGRMMFALTYASDPSGDRQARLMLTVRGRPASRSREDCTAFLDEGRRLIVHTFAHITTPEAHKIWSKE